MVSAANGGTWGWTMVYCECGLASFSFLFGSSLSYFLFSNALILLYFLYYVWGWTVAHMFGLSTRLKCYCDSHKKKKMLLQMLGTFSFKAIQNNCDYVTEALAGFC
jgi:hypothetical protein